MGEDADCFDFGSISRKIVANMSDAFKEAKQRTSGYSHFADQRRIFSLDGSIVISDSFFVDNPSEFFQKSRRAVKYRGQYHLRGARYTIASNPTYELRQKIDTLLEDFRDAILGVTNYKSLILQVALADYIKNSSITLLNSYLYSEKIGKYHFEDPIYQSLRREGQRLCEAAVYFFYSLMGKRGNHVGLAFEELMANVGAAESMADKIIESYKDGIFSSRHITRPEAAHPGIIALSALGAVRKTKQPELLIGLPSGSTELAMAHQTAWRIFKKSKPNLLLFPISLHSVKHDFDDKPG